jgi:carbon monoxide dehydrogenase subunit G
MRMVFEGKIDVRAPAQKAWDFLTDIKSFSSCMPGLEKVTQIDERTFGGIIAASVGPISGQFSFRATIVDSKPPDELVVRTEGTDSVTGSRMNADVTINMREPLKNHTQLEYRADVQIQGRLAILGDMIVRATASLMLEDFAERLRKQLEGRAAKK